MAGIAIGIKIDKELIKLDKTIQKGILDGLGVAAVQIQNEAKAIGTAGGWVDRTGSLKAGILAEKPNESEMSVTIVADPTRIRARQDYASYLEDGTRNKDGTVRIRPVKFMQRATNKVLSILDKIIVIAIERVVK